MMRSLAQHAGLRRSGPIVAKTGQTIQGMRITGTGGAAVTVPEGVTDVVIEDSYITAPGETEFCRGVDIHPRASRITVRRCHIDDVSSCVYAAQALHPLVVHCNLLTRVRGPLPRGQGVQFNAVVDGRAQSRIQGNVFDQAVMVEDWINMFASAGSAEYPVLIAGNRQRGGGRQVLNADGTRKWDASGSGICLGDYGGGHFDVLHNLLVCTQNTGIGIAGAHDVRAIGNVICNAGLNADSQTRSAITVATYAGNRPRRVTLRGNRCVAYNWLIDPANPVYKPGALAAGFWTDGTCEDLVQEGNQWQDETLTPDVWDQVYREDAVAIFLLARAAASAAAAHTPAAAYAQARRAAFLMPAGATPFWLQLYAARLHTRANPSAEQLQEAAAWATRAAALASD